jgi:hypothetical protein
MIREDQPKATSVRPTVCSEIVRMSTVTSHQVRPRLGSSLPPLGKPLVSVWKREPGTGERLNERAAQGGRFRNGLHNLAAHDLAFHVCILGIPPVERGHDIGFSVLDRPVSLTRCVETEFKRISYGVFTP